MKTKRRIKMVKMFLKNQESFLFIFIILLFSFSLLASRGFEFVAVGVSLMAFILFSFAMFCYYSKEAK